MKISDKRGKQCGEVVNPVPGTVILSKNRYLLITDDPDICVNLYTGLLLEPPEEIFNTQILYNAELVVK